MKCHAVASLFLALATGVSARTPDDLKKHHRDVVFTPKDMLAMPRPAAVVVGPDGHLGLSSVSQHSFETRKYGLSTATPRETADSSFSAGPPHHCTSSALTKRPGRSRSLHWRAYLDNSPSPIPFGFPIRHSPISTEQAQTSRSGPVDSIFLHMTVSSSRNLVISWTFQLQALLRLSSSFLRISRMRRLLPVSWLSQHTCGRVMTSRIRRDWRKNMLIGGMMLWSGMRPIFGTFARPCFTLTIC